MKSLLEQIEEITLQVQEDGNSLASLEQVENFRLKYLVKKGLIPALTEQLRTVPPAEKPLVGKSLNILKKLAQEVFDTNKERLALVEEEKVTVDLTLPGRRSQRGTRHPISATIDEMTAIFRQMGFAVAVGPEIEDDHHNFSALNFPPDHPARDMQDTFFVQSKEGAEAHLLRTHTSPVQVRLMEAGKLPIRAVMPGRVYRNEAVSARSLAEFHQIEGLYIDKNVTMAELKGTLVEFARRFYGSSVRYKFRPSYFPFTEPSAEMDITCFLCAGKGCRVCKHSGWLEILGCGMVHPNVLRASNIDPEEYSGYAFGMGIERVTMLRTGITDIRLLYENDVRLLHQVQ